MMDQRQCVNHRDLGDNMNEETIELLKKFHPKPMNILVPYSDWIEGNLSVEEEKDYSDTYEHISQE